MVADIQHELDRWTARIQQIDQALEPAIVSLIDIASWNVDVSNVSPDSHPFAGWVREPMYFPAWLTNEREPERQERINLTTALCVRVLQRLWVTRRRFPNLETRLEALHTKLGARGQGRDVAEFLADAFLPPTDQADPYRQYIKTANLMARWYPFSTANILWVLLRGGESKAYTGTGVLAVFAMIWSLHGSDGGAGAAIGMLPASAYVTNSCLTAIRSLAAACRRRAEIVRGIADRIEEIDKLAVSVADKRQLPFQIDALLNLLYEFRRVAITGPAFEDQLSEIDRISRGWARDAREAEVWAKVRGELRSIVRNIATTGEVLIKDFEAVRAVLAEVSATVGEVAQTDDAAPLKKLEALGISVPPVEFTRRDARQEFWRKRHFAAQLAARTCDAAMTAFERSVKALALPPTANASELARAFRAIEVGNEAVVSAIIEAVEPSDRWCANVVMREIANASSGNWTEFDPAELAGGLESATLSRAIENPQLITDAVLKILEGLRGRGGWIAGQPFMLDETFSMSAVAPAADVVFIVTRVLRAHPEITAADELLLSFVDWVQSSRKEFSIQQLSQSSLPKELHLIGWVSERQVRPRRIDLWNTAFTIDALLELRSLFEDRLWALCERRFTIVAETGPLEKVAATDLDTPHGRRLHRKLAQMAYATSGQQYRQADYSLVLHGPPGSAKTKIVGALATELWRSDRVIPRPVRLIRITPADFTHRGEALVDFEARLIFTLLSNVRRVTVLFDEIDDLLRRRVFEETPSFLKLVVPAMLNRLQDLRDVCPRQELCFVLATNYIDNIEPALIRKGRIDAVIPLVYPDRSSREFLVDARLRKFPLAASWAATIVRPLLIGDRTDRWPYKAIDGLSSAVAAAASTMKPIDEEALRAEVEAMLADGASYGALPYDARRLQNAMLSDAFRDEVLAYVLSGVSSEAEYLAAIRKLFPAGKGSSALLQHFTDAGKRIWRRLRW